MSAFSRWWGSARDAIRTIGRRDGKQKRIKTGLDGAYARAGEPQRIDVEHARIIVFSDHHRGRRDGADDFLRCERAYRAALAYYLESGHTLALLGDVEELWENALPGPLERYADVLALEREFHRAGRLWRFYGNHDLTWSGERAVREHLEGPMGGPITVREALKLDVYADGRRHGQLFLAHGHQGTLDSDVLFPVARIPVRTFWPWLQRKVKFASTSPARDYELRESHDTAMFEWARARSEPLVLITGHTHKPVFRKREKSSGLPDRERLPSPEEARADLERARAAGLPPGTLAAKHAVYEFVATPDHGAPPRVIDPPCYFNTGCCSFADADITGLEIADGEIRLVRWLNKDGKPDVHVLASDSLVTVLDEVEAARA